MRLSGLELMGGIRNPYDRPTADKLLGEHPFCELDANYDFRNTGLHARIRGRDLE